MSERIDFVTVTRAAEGICSLYDYENTAQKLAELRAAIAEMIEADKEYDKARKAHGDTYHSGGMVARRDTRKKLEAAKLRRNAALSSIGGPP